MDYINPSFENICRTCLCSLQISEKQKNSVFSEDIKEKIVNLTSFQLYENDGLPNFICTKCMELLDLAYSFKRQIETSEEKLREQLKTEHLPEPTYDDDSVDSSSLNEIPKLEPIEMMEEYEDYKFDVTSNKGFRPRNAYDRKNEQKKAPLRLKNESKNKKKCLNKCPDCGKVYANVYDFTVHCRSHNGLRPHSCTVCDKTFADLRCLKKHQQIHTGIKPYKCELCDKSFIRKHVLHSHLKRHKGERSVLCSSCGQLFCTGAELNIHNKRHHVLEKPYKCKSCPKAFHTKSNLVNHETAHTGQSIQKEKKFVCSICSKKWRDNSDLKAHFRTHTGEKPFKCKFPNCTRTFKTNSHMNAHLKSHTDERNHNCSICSKSFRSPYQLKKHIRVHTGEKPYVCSFCGHRFSQNGALYNHLKIHKRLNSCKDSLINTMN